MFLWFLFLSFSGSATAGVSATGREQTDCEQLKTFLNGFMSDGYFVTNQLRKTVPSVSVHIKIAYGKRRSSVMILDIDHDNDYEILYKASVTNPRHVETKLYLLMDLSLEEAEGLIDEGRKSKFYEPIAEEIWERFTCDPMGILIDAEPINIDYSEFFTKSENEKVESKSVFRTTLFGYEHRNYLIVEELTPYQKSLTVLSILDVEKELIQFECKFSFDNNNLIIEAH
jgi:hypothetical protein